MILWIAGHADVHGSMFTLDAGGVWQKWRVCHDGVAIRAYKPLLMRTTDKFGFHHKSSASALYEHRGWLRSVLRQTPAQIHHHGIVLMFAGLCLLRSDYTVAVGYRLC